MPSAPIVVGYDGTTGARSAIDEAVRLASAFDAELVVAFAYWYSPFGGETADLVAALREHGEQRIAEAMQTLEDSGARARGEVVEGHPAGALVTLADSIDAQMIVVGSYGERPLKGAIVGSTPHQLMHLSQRPVLVVRARE